MLALWQKVIIKDTITKVKHINLFINKKSEATVHSHIATKAANEE